MQERDQQNWLKFCIRTTLAELNKRILLPQLHSEACVCELTSLFSPKTCLLSECPRITHLTPISDIMAGLISPANKRNSKSCEPEFIHTTFTYMGTIWCPDKALDSHSEGSELILHADCIRFFCSHIGTFTSTTDITWGCEENQTSLSLEFRDHIELYISSLLIMSHYYPNTVVKKPAL